MSADAVCWDAVASEAADLLSRYIQINTTNPPGNETEGALFLKRLLERESIDCEMYAPEEARASVVSRCRSPAGRPEVMLLHHIDVVPTEPERWQHPPFSGALIDGEIWGRGALDCKSLGIMELMAMLLLKRRGFDPERRIVYAATADEEAGGGRGVRWLMQHKPQVLETAAVINEGVGWGLPSPPGGLCLCQIAEKSACWVRITFQGAPGHGSLPRENNCVVHMTRALSALSRHRFPVSITEPARMLITGLSGQQQLVPPGDFLQLLDPAHTGTILERIADPEARTMIEVMLRNTAVPTVVHAGEKTNVIPGQCRCEVDCRLLPGYTADQLREELTALLRENGCGDFSLDIRGNPVPCHPSPVDTPVYRALSESFSRHGTGLPMLPYMSPGATDSRFFREKGIPAYGIQIDGSLRAAQLIHGDDERIGVERLLMGIRVLYDALEPFCC